MSIDLTTRYGSLTLKSPIIVGACPLTAQEQTRVAMESAGAGGIVLPSLFEEQIVVWNQQRGKTLSPREQTLLAGSEQMRSEACCATAESYLSLVNRASAQMSIPVIASLNGEIAGDWLDFAGELEEAGAAGIELAVHHSWPDHYSGPREIEHSIVELVSRIDEAISIPLFLKLGREYTSISHLTRQLLSGVQGVVLFGRKPDVEICLDTLAIKSSWGLTHAGSISQSLAAIMRVHACCPAMSIAACGGIGSAQDVAKALLAGADVGLMISAIYREGPDVIRSCLDGLVEFMEHHRFSSVSKLMQNRPLQFPSQTERREYVKSLSSRLEALDEESCTHELHGDRYGHVARSSQPHPESPPPQDIPGSEHPRISSG